MQQQQQQQQLKRLHIFQQHRRQKQQHHHPHYFKMPNLSFLYMIMIVLSFLLLFVTPIYAQKSSALVLSGGAASTTSRVRLSRNETVCKSMDIRNTPSEFRQLENCTVIEGFLLITLVNTHAQEEFTETFPLLTEVTEFLIVYRVYYLRSLSQIFPNLTIIRGHALQEGYALVVYSNPHLEDLGLSKLTTISRGGVRIENNLSLCYVETIDWTQIANSTDIVIKKNRNIRECPQCPGQDGPTSDNELMCKVYHGRRWCWNSKHCQKMCPDRCRNNCVDENTCCNEACLGGCSAHDINECTSCRHFSIYGNTCTDKCPSNYVSMLDRRCLTAKSCIGKKFENNKQETLVTFNGVCSTRCPDGYFKVNSTCEKCVDKCMKKCPGGLIDSIASAKQFHGCTHIVESGLIISIKRGGRHLMEDLEFGLSSIEEITTYLKVHRTYGMFSLEFFKNLKMIRGEKLCEEQFALYVLENNDLETIWNPNQTVYIDKGRVFFHFNQKLCYSEIEALRPMMRNNSSFNKNEVATDSNGYRGSCGTEFLNTTINKLHSNVAVVEVVNPLKFEDERTFIGYQLFYIEDKFKNATKHGYRLCDDGWSSLDPTKETKFVITNLEPFTQYAYYVKTMTISSEPRNAESPIQYFKTKSARPKPVRNLNAYSNSSSEIVISWLPPAKVYGNLTMYKLSAKLDKQNHNTDMRNYCQDPLKKAAVIEENEPAVKPPPKDKTAVDPDCKCRKDPDSLYEEEDDDFNRHDSMTFENELQDFVYVKQSNDTTPSSGNENTSMTNNIDKNRKKRHITGDSYLLRHMRDTTNELDMIKITSIVTSSTTISPVVNATNKTTTVPNGPPAEVSIMDEKGEYFEILFGTVNATTNEFVFKQLKHFAIYEISVQACREEEEGATKENCSEVQPKHVRTQKLDNVDVVHNLFAQLETTNTSRSNIRLGWLPPESPNGAIVSYTISYLLNSPDAVEEKRCVTEKDYQNWTNGYLLTDLPSGNYSVRVRANSLAGEGIYSDVVYINIPRTQLSTTAIVLICVGVSFVLLLIIGFLLYLRKKQQEAPSALKMFPTVNPHYISLQYVADEWEVPRDRVIQLLPLGQGSFGMVYEGILKGFNDNSRDTPCAIKTVNENATDGERMNFLKEATVMKQFNTHHVVHLLGVCSMGQPALVVMELMKNGDLKSYLRAHRPDEMMDGINPLQPPPLSRIYQMAMEIADGMAYLSAKKFVHRDLAARNCMVAADLTVKIGDFGMARDVYENDYYRKGTKGLLPVRWMSPESLRDGVYLSTSDVFSYGVVLWEMATFASQPYPGYSNEEVLRYVVDGGVMERPDNCPDKLYHLMQRCWHHRPSARPTFMEIVQYLMESAEPHFQEVSFYHSPDGEEFRAKELAENMQQFDDTYNDNENDDVHTPLRMGEYNEYKLNLDNNSSVEHQGDSPNIILDDVQPHSPYSLESAMIVSSTPEGQSKNSYNVSSQMSHNNNATLSSAPSTSHGITNSLLQNPMPHTHPQSNQRQLHQPSNRRFQLGGLAPLVGASSAADAAAYVQPDFDDQHLDSGAGTSGKSLEMHEERGYEIYDPSPNYREQGPGYDPADDEEDFDGIETGMRTGRLSSGGQNLLPRPKGKQRLPSITPISTSVPNETINVPIDSALHPSTASAASSNASSTTTSKYPSLKKAVADTVQNVGSSLIPNRLKNINRRFFNHKRTGSNASHNSTSSNPNATSNSNTNLTSGSGQVKSMSGQNLGTIESGGSGSGSSYAAHNPRFYTPATATTSDSPNYKLLDETANASIISAAAAATANEPNSSTPAKSTASTSSKYPLTGFTTSSNPNYQLLNESLNTTGTPTRSVFGGTAATPTTTAPTQMFTSSNPNYIMMNQPNYQTMNAPATLLTTVSDNPNYQIMAPQVAPEQTQPEPTYTNTNTGTTTTTTTPSSQPFTSKLSAALRRDQSLERLSNSDTTSSSSEDDENEDDNDIHTEHIKMERIPLNRRRPSERSEQQKRSSQSRSRSRSQSQTKRSPENKTNVTTPARTLTGNTKMTPARQLAKTTASSLVGTVPTMTQARPSTFSLKESWLKQQSQHPPPPPPNGFIGREA